MNRPSVLIPIAPGTNRNEELAVAFQAAGADTAEVPLQDLRSGRAKLADHQILALPGGFSYGDALGAGRLLALDLAGWFAEQLDEARNRQLPIIGICNGFQALVKAGLLPGPEGTAGLLPGPEGTAGLLPGPDGTAGEEAVADAGKAEQTATLTHNANGRFECRWVNLAPGAAHSVWTGGLSAPIRCPVAHGEGRFVAGDLSALDAADRIAFRYCGPAGSPAGGTYPANPNGSAGDVAGIVDASGLILGLMPHPEDHVFVRQDPQRRRGPGGGCLPLFQAGVAAVAAD